MSSMMRVTRPSPMPSVMEPPSDALASPCANRLYMAAPLGSPMPITMSFFFSRRQVATVRCGAVDPSPFPAGRPPDFRAGGDIVSLAVVQIVPLVRKQHAVGLVLAQLVRKAPSDVLIIVAIAVGHRRHFHQLGAAQAQHVFLFLALGFRDHDQGAVAAGIGDERQSDAGVAGGGLDPQPPGPDLAALFRLQDHLPRGTVLHRLAGIHEFSLAQNGASRRGGGALEHDQRRIADGVDDSVPSLHFVMPSAFATGRNLDDALSSDKRPREGPVWVSWRRDHALETRPARSPQAEASNIANHVRGAYRRT